MTYTKENVVPDIRKASDFDIAMKDAFSNFTSATNSDVDCIMVNPSQGVQPGSMDGDYPSPNGQFDYHLDGSTTANATYGHKRRPASFGLDGSTTATTKTMTAPTAKVDSDTTTKMTTGKKFLIGVGSVAFISLVVVAIRHYSKHHAK